MQTCPNCGYQNRAGVMFCENCGASLIGNTAPAETQSLKGKGIVDPSEKVPGTEVTLEEIESIDFHEGDEFPSGGYLHLEVGEGITPMIVPVEEKVLFGRRDTAMGAIPNVDLTPFAGYRMGVSRHHAEIRLEADGRLLNLYDLGSSNGTFINGDRLISHRSYRLRDNDEIRFGQLEVRVRFLKADHVQKDVVEISNSASDQNASMPSANHSAPEVTQARNPLRDQLSVSSSGAVPKAKDKPHASASAEAPAQKPHTAKPEAEDARPLSRIIDADQIRDLGLDAPLKADVPASKNNIDKQQATSAKPASAQKQQTEKGESSQGVSPPAADKTQPPKQNDNDSADDAV